MIDAMNLKRFMTYALVGVAGTAVQYVALIGLVHAGASSPPVASCIGALLGAVVNYALNHWFTFRGNRSHVSAAPRFFAVAGFGLAANWVGMTVLSLLLGLNYLVAQAITTVAVLAFTYLANAAWSFRETTTIA